MRFYRPEPSTSEESPSSRRRVIDMQPRPRAATKAGRRRDHVETPVARALGLHDCKLCRAECRSADALAQHLQDAHADGAAEGAPVEPTWRMERRGPRQNEGLSGMRGSNFAGAASQASLFGYWEIGWVPDNDGFVPDPVIASYYRARGGFLTGVNGRRFW